MEKSEREKGKGKMRQRLSFEAMDREWRIKGGEKERRVES